MRIAFLMSAVLLSTAALGAPPSDLDQRVESLMKTSGVPGLGLAIVENGKAEIAKGYGVRRLGRPDAVDADTIFPNGSTGKAFTTAALAVLVDQGRLSWDDKVTDRLPGFEMYDPWVTREMTIRDLLVHNSGLGLGAGDLLFVPRGSLSRADAVRRLRYIKPKTSFRSAYAYDNVLYMVAGQLIEAVSGQSWEVFVRESVLKPAGMLHSTSDLESRLADADRAQPHARTNGAIRGVGDQDVLDERSELGRAAAPAGGLAVSANDMSRWLLIQLAHGKFPEGSGRLFSEAGSKEMWTPRTLIPLSDPPKALAATAAQFHAYALGWDISDYKGHKIITHGGAVLGFLAIVVLLPEKNVGFCALINSEDGVVLRALEYELLDHYLGEPKFDWGAALEATRKARVEMALAKIGAASSARAKVGPSLPKSGYAGNYADPWYGPVSITEKNGKLWLDFKQTPNMIGELEHWQYDTFKATWTDKTIEPAFVTFALDSDGHVQRIAMKPFSPTADFSYDYQDLDFTPEKKQ